MPLSLTAREILANSDCTFVSINNNKTYASELHGISPILKKLQNDDDFFNGAEIADKVIGKAAAFLLIYGKVKAVYADIISEPAKDLFEQHNIPLDFRRIVPYIINRSGDGMCPMEKCVLDTDDVFEAYEKLKEKIS